MARSALSGAGPEGDVILEQPIADVGLAGVGALGGIFANGDGARSNGGNRPARRQSQTGAIYRRAVFSGAGEGRVHPAAVEVKRACRSSVRFLPQKCWTKRLQENLSRQDAKAQSDTRCHFDRREKSFLDPSHSLGMTDLGPSLGVFASLRESSLFRFCNVKLNLKFQRSLATPFSPHGRQTRCAARQ